MNSSESPPQRDISGNKIKSKIERMEQIQKLTFAKKNSQNVADPPPDDLPGHRITLRVGMKHPCSTSY